MTNTWMIRSSLPPVRSQQRLQANHSKFDFKFVKQPTLCYHEFMKFIFPLFALFIFTSCDSMEMNAQDQPTSSSPCAACENCGSGSSEAKEAPKPTS